jgi:hypothetical protein
MALTFPHANDYCLGAGYVSFAAESSSTTEGTAFVYLGQTSGFSIGGVAETITADSYDTPVAEELVRIVKKVTRESQITLNDIDAYNMGLFLMGSSSAVTQTTGSGTTAITMSKGKYFKLGGDDVQDISLGTGGVHQGATVSGTAVAASGGKNWEVDLANGVIYFPTGTAMSTGAVTVAYGKLASSWDKVVTGATPVYGSLMFIGDNTVGENRRVKISRCVLAPNGQLEFKSRDNFMAATMTIGILTRGVTPQVQVWGAPA